MKVVFRLVKLFSCLPSLSHRLTVGDRPSHSCRRAPSLLSMSIELTTEPQALDVRLGGANGLFSLKRRLEVPTHLITSVEAIDRKAIPPGEGTWLRAPGTYIPGLIRHGSYGRPPHREFWAVFRQKRVLVITIRDWEYARVILAIRDPEMHASAVSAAIS